MINRIFATVLLLTILLSAVSCQAQNSVETEEEPKKTHPIANVDKTDETPKAEEEIDDADANYWVDLVLAGNAQYTVVSESKEYDELAEYLVVGLRNNTGVSFPLKRSTDTWRVTTKIISVGKNPQSLLPRLDDSEELTYLGNWSVDADKTIYLTGFCKSAVGTTVDKFLSGILLKYRETDEKGRIQVKVPDIRLFFLENPTNYIKTSAKLLGVDLSEYVIVLPKEANAAETLMAQYLITEIGTNTGCVIKCVSDQKRKAAHEIVLGKTNRSESQMLYANLASEHYAIKSVDGSLYVAYDNYLVMEDSRTVINNLCLDDSITSVDQSVKPDYHSQGLHKQDESYVRVMTSNIVCAGDAGAVEKYDINGITCETRVGLQGVMMMDYLPDFVGMQEMQEGRVNGVYSLMHTELLKTVGSEYSFVQYSNLAATEYWNPILYRHTVWQLEAQEASEPFDNAMHRWQWALFSRIENPSEKYIVMNLHYPTGKNPEKQMAAAEIVNAQIQWLQEEYSGIPVFLTGDFNAKVETKVFEATFAQTGLVTANMNKDAIDHVVYDSDRLTKKFGMFINNSWIYLTSDHRPYFADFS